MLSCLPVFLYFCLRSRTELPTLQSGPILLGDIKPQIHVNWSLVIRLNANVCTIEVLYELKGDSAMSADFVALFCRGNVGQNLVLRPVLFFMLGFYSFYIAGRQCVLFF